MTTPLAMPQRKPRHDFRQPYVTVSAGMPQVRNRAEQSPDNARRRRARRNGWQPAELPDPPDAVLQDYAASFGTSTVMHAIKGAWSYDAISDAVTLCGRPGPFTVNSHHDSQVTITCRTCIRLSKEH